MIEARDQALQEGWETAAKRFLFSIGSKYQEIPDAVNNRAGRVVAGHHVPGGGFRKLPDDQPVPPSRGSLATT